MATITTQLGHYFMPDSENGVVLHCPYQPCPFTAQTMTPIINHVCLNHQKTAQIEIRLEKRENVGPEELGLKYGQDNH